MNDYEQRVADRKARLEASASKIQAASNSTYSRAKRMADCIPFGQPIHVGHHSEGSDRRFRSRIHDTFGKAFALQDKAAHYAQKAESVGTGGISSDDPEAIQKLRAELAEHETRQALMKDANKAIKKGKTPEARVAALVVLGISQTEASELVAPTKSWNRIGFPSYALTNNNANIRRIQARIEMLTAAKTRNTIELTGNGYTLRQDVEENRVMFIFPGKPDEATRSLLKSWAFKWSPTRGAWVRQLNNSAVSVAMFIRKQLDTPNAE